MISRELQQQQGRKSRFLLRKGEVWVRKAGGRQLATAEDIDAMYEAKLLSVARDAAEPLNQRIEILERELARLKSALPTLSFGVALPGEPEPAQEAPVRPANEVLFTQEEFEELVAELAWAKERAQRARQERNAGSMLGFSTRLSSGPSPQEYMDYGENLEGWLHQLRGFVMVELALSNTGEVPAEDVSVEIEIPPELSARKDLPREKLERPVDTFIRSFRTPSLRYTRSKQNAPEDLLGPAFDHDRRLAVWEIGRLYHGRPVRTDSHEESVSGLLLDRAPFERLASERDSVQLPYTLRAANLRRPVEGTLRLLPASEG
jgi:hypothetical protein